MDYKKLIELCIEIEGLLRVLSGRPDCAEAMSLLQRRRNEFAALMNVQAECQPGPTCPTCPAAPVAEELATGNNDDFIIVLDGDDPDVIEEIKETGHPARTQPKTELRRCFTLNDKFRFIRELFGGNEREFTDTLAVISGMDDSAEAVEYICNDLAMNREEPCVAEFLSIIEANMPAKNSDEP